MSYTVKLKRPNGDLCSVQSHTEGSTYAVGGITDAEIHITFNYSNFLAFLDKKRGLRWLNGQLAVDTVPRLTYAISFLGTQVYTGPFHVLKLPAIWDTGYQEDVEIRKLIDSIDKEDLDAPGNEGLLKTCLSKGVVYNTGGYWKSTPGNVGHVLSILLKWAKMNPSGIWEIS